MSFRFTERILNTPKSFIREILKVTQDPEIISFAGGLPNPSLFPIEALQEAARETLATAGARALQYSTTEGHAELRAWIAARYERRGVTVDPDQVLITTGSQQCLDLLGKLFIEKGDEVILERPSYLGTIQAFTMFEPRFVTVDLEEDGPNLEQAERLLATGRPKLFYAVPNFQNPSGLTYSMAKREALGALLRNHPETIFIEDDPYGELRFSGEHHKPLYAYTEGRSIMLGSFSKITVPGFRLGWMVAPPEIIRLAVKAKQAADLHSSTFNQFVIAEYLKRHSIDDHIAKITGALRSPGAGHGRGPGGAAPGRSVLHPARRRHVLLGHPASGQGLLHGPLQPGHRPEGGLRAGHALLHTTARARTPCA
jgi:2-aminoadipate transaminase